MPSDLLMPVIHLNGTSKERLIEALCEASNKLNDAYEALKETAPNGRDYYPIGPSAIITAQEQHHSRLRRLDEIKSEIDQITESIDI